MRQYQLVDYEPNGATCPVCGNTYKGRSGLSKHHAAQHGGKFKPIAACDNCGRQYTENVSNIHASENHYCSEECRKEAYSNSREGEQNALYKERIKKECDECGSPFEVRPCETHQRFCGRDCYDEHQTTRTGEKNHNWAGRVEKECGWCNSEFEVVPARKDTARFCSIDCRHDWLASRTGKDHPLWQGGVNWYRAIRSSLGPTGWRTQRKEHLEDECRLCGGSSGTLALHHIVPVLSGGTNTEYNYMTLCRGCHSTVETYTQGNVPGTEPLLFE